MLTLKFFAACAEQMGKREDAAALQPSPGALLNALPELACLKAFPNLRVAVNQAWADWDTPLREGDEVAFLPPVSGG